MKHGYAKSISYLAMFSLISLILSYIESLIPPLISFPGIKLGLANTAVIFVLYKADLKGAAIVSLVRVIISSLLFGSVVSLMYSLCGAIFSLAVMFFLKKLGCFSEIAVSVAGAVMHNIAQLLVAYLLFSVKEIVYYLPILMISSVITGIFIGIVSAVLIRKIKISF